MRQLLPLFRWWLSRPKSAGSTLLVVVAVVGFLLFRPAIERMTGGRVGTDRQTTVTTTDVESPKKATTGSPPVINGDTASRPDRPASKLNPNAAPPATKPATAPTSRQQSPAQAPASSRATQSQPTTSNPKSTERNTQASKTPAKEPLGKLKKVSGQVYETTAGLRYGPGSAEGHRLKHVARHFEDSPNRPIHGYFSGSERENFAAIDEAYLIATTDPKRAKVTRERGRVIYEVDLRRKIGFIGGESGKRKGNPAVTGVRLVLEGENVITAFPVEIRRRR